MKFNSRFSGDIITLALLHFFIAVATAAPRAPLPPLPEFAPVSFSERFDGYYTNGMTVAEIVVSGSGTLVESWSGYALQRVGNVVPLVIDGVQNGHTNVFPGGAVRLWVKPDWASASTGTGQGPGQVAKIAELSVVANGQAAVAWSLQVGADGSTLLLVGAGVNESGVLLTAELAWQVGEWHQVVLNYTEKGTALILDGELAAEGAGVLAVPSSAAVLAIGSSLLGTQSFAGELEDVYCFARPLQWAFHYLPYKGTAALGPISAEYLALRAEWAEQRKAAKALKAQAEEESGGGLMLRMAGPSVDCLTNGPVYLTNVVCTFTTNEGWTIFFDIAGGTNEVVYDIFATPELVGNDITNSVWTWLESGMTCETHYFTNQATNQTFYILTVPGADRDGDGLYDGWEWKHFGTLAQTAEGDFDGDGMNNGEAYTNDYSPNNLSFALIVTNFFVRSTTVPITVSLTTGSPASMAVLVDNTNTAAANWTSYESDLNVSFPATEGWHEVRVGLRGHFNENVVWQMKRIKYDVTAPLLVVTNPVVVSGAQPLLQLQGYGNESLGRVTFGLTNAAGHLTNQTGFVTFQNYSTNHLEFTTNYFHCFDLRLTNGVNTITLEIADLAGNTTATNLTFTLDGSGATNPPIISLVWPQSGATLSAEAFTVNGFLDDPSASLVVSLVSSSGLTNVFNGLVGRRGEFWVEHLSLESGTNQLYLTATDVWGNYATTNLTVIKAGFDLTVDTLTPEQFAQFSTTITGTISDPDQDVWVNGILATVSNGVWQAENVPVSHQPTVTLQVKTVPTGSDPNTTPSTAEINQMQESPPLIEVTSYHERQTGEALYPLFGGQQWVQTSDALVQDWVEGSGGAYSQRSREERLSPPYVSDCTVTATIPPQLADARAGFPGTDSCVGAVTVGFNPVGRHIATDVAGTSPGNGGTASYSSSWRLDAQTALKTNGKDIPGEVNTYLVKVQAADANSGPVPLRDVLVEGRALTPNASDPTVGEVLVQAPSGTTLAFTPQVTSSDNYTRQSQVELVKIEFRSVNFSATNGYYPLIPDTNSFGYYPTPHWTPTNSSPVMFVSGSRMQALVMVSVANLPTNTALVFKGETGRGITFWGTTNLVSGTNIFVLTVADQPLAAGKVDFFNPLTIHWSVAIAGGANFHEVGKSTNQVYVTLRAPTELLLGDEFRHTVLHLACANSGATDVEQAAANTWAFFAGPANVKTWDGVSLVYYGTTNGGNNVVVSELLLNRDGQCYAFAGLLIAAFRANGDTNAEECVVSPPSGHNRFAIKNVNFSSAPTYPSEPDFKYAETDLDYTPFGIPGQNTNPPKRKRFDNHRIIRRSVGIYYDPSYGITTTDAMGYTTNVAAWQRPDTKWRSAVGATNSLRFFP
jgi:hypothetical protein